MNRDFKGIWIPAIIWLTDGLSISEKALWAEIDSLYNPQKGGCHASNDYLGEFIGVKMRRLQEMLAKLKKMNLLLEVGFDGRQRLLKAVLPHQEECSQPPPESGNPHGRGAEKCTPAVKDSAPPIYKEERKAYKKEKRQTSPMASVAAHGAALLLLKKIREGSPDMLGNHLKLWTKEADLMLRIDKRSPEKIAQIIEWCFEEDNYWCGKILSMKTLRGKFDTLLYQQRHPSKEKIEKDEAEVKRKYVEKNEQWACPIKRMNFPEFTRSLSVQPYGVDVKNGGERNFIPYEQPSFTTIILNRLKKWNMAVELSIMEKMAY